MYKLVTFELRKESKALTTFGTFMWCIASVEAAEVSAQCGRLSKTLTTLLTFVRFLASMGAHVPGQVRFLNTAFIAYRTFIRFFASMGANVPCQIGRERECFATIVASI
ncbi:hypothetical protein CEXT_32951 [Caerostris extrusa]|uniref:Secreted protein n=1 Tax=Caerostris extrusa TaxID=172846 RepID=A0AAV4WPN0_CAEEX|nr:hypothetical protein CEXT_32951 [Caerostris extrusa]